MTTNLTNVAPSSGAPRVSDVGIEWPVLPAEYCEARWYAAYTRANHEKRVAEQLGLRQVEHFLPTFRSVRRWKDRRVQLDLPLFPAYVFLRIALRDRLCALEIPGVVRLVGFSGVPTALSADQVEALRVGLAIGVRAEPHPYLTARRRVRIKSGPLVGLTGTLLKHKSMYRVVLSIELIQRSVAVHVDLSDIELAE